jgi:hypothetical protein
VLSCDQVPNRPSAEPSPAPTSRCFPDPFLALAAAETAGGAFIELVGPTAKHEEYREEQQTEILAFIDKLKGMGII